MIFAYSHGTACIILTYFCPKSGTAIHGELSYRDPPCHSRYTAISVVLISVHRCRWTRGTTLGIHRQTRRITLGTSLHPWYTYLGTPLDPPCHSRYTARSVLLMSVHPAGSVVLYRYNNLGTPPAAWPPFYYSQYPAVGNSVKNKKGFGEKGRRCTGGTLYTCCRTIPLWPMTSEHKLCKVPC